MEGRRASATFWNCGKSRMEEEERQFPKKCELCTFLTGRGDEGVDGLEEGQLELGVVHGGVAHSTEAKREGGKSGGYILARLSFSGVVRPPDRRPNIIICAQRGREGRAYEQHQQLPPSEPTHTLGMGRGRGRRGRGCWTLSGMGGEGRKSERDPPRGICQILSRAAPCRQKAKSTLNDLKSGQIPKIQRYFSSDNLAGEIFRFRRRSSPPSAGSATVPIEREREREKHGAESGASRQKESPSSLPLSSRRKMELPRTHRRGGGGEPLSGCASIRGVGDGRTDGRRDASWPEEESERRRAEGRKEGSSQGSGRPTVPPPPTSNRRRRKRLWARRGAILGGRADGRTDGRQSAHGRTKQHAFFPDGEASSLADYRAQKLSWLRRGQILHTLLGPPLPAAAAVCYYSTYIRWWRRKRGKALLSQLKPFHWLPLTAVLLQLRAKRGEHIKNPCARSPRLSVKRRKRSSGPPENLSKCEEGPRPPPLSPSRSPWKTQGGGGSFLAAENILFLPSLSFLPPTPKEGSFASSKTKEEEEEEVVLSSSVPHPIPSQLLRSSLYVRSRKTRHGHGRRDQKEKERKSPLPPFLACFPRRKKGGRRKGFSLSRSLFEGGWRARCVVAFQCWSVPPSFPRLSAASAADV